MVHRSWICPSQITGEDRRLATDVGFARGRDAFEVIERALSEIGDWIESWADWLRWPKAEREGDLGFVFPEYDDNEEK